MPTATALEIMRERGTMFCEVWYNKCVEVQRFFSFWIDCHSLVKPLTSTARNQEDGNLLYEAIMNNKKRAVEERFWNKVNKNTDNGCWEWLAGFNKEGGYGRIKINRKDELAHRVSWEIANGPIPEGKHILHKCDNTKCVNPSHLFVGTQADNIRDAVSKGRNGYPKGEAHPWSKLTASEVVRLRKEYKTIKRGYKTKYVTEQSKKLCVKFETIEAVIRGRTWKHLNGTN